MAAADTAALGNARVSAMALRARTCVTAVRTAKIQFQDRMWNKGRTTVNTTMQKVMTKTICCS